MNTSRLGDDAHIGAAVSSAGWMCSAGSPDRPCASAPEVDGGRPPELGKARRRRPAHHGDCAATDSTSASCSGLSGCRQLVGHSPVAGAPNRPAALHRASIGMDATTGDLGDGLKAIASPVAGARGRSVLRNHHRILRTPPTRSFPVLPDEELRLLQCFIGWPVRTRIEEPKRSPRRVRARSIGSAS